jgi:hypothetical protein
MPAPQPAARRITVPAPIDQRKMWTNFIGPPYSTCCLVRERAVMPVGIISMDQFQVKVAQLVQDPGESRLIWDFNGQVGL